MGSTIDPSKPTSATTANKSDLRLNLQRARDELNHGGFFKHSGLAVSDQVERTVQQMLSHHLPVMAYNASGDGTGDDSGPLQAAIDDAFSRNNGSMPPLAVNANNNHNVVVDLGGRSYQIGQPLNIPLGAAVEISHGAIKASSSFPEGQALLRWPDGNGKTHSIRCRYLGLDGNHRANGALVRGNFLRPTFDTCQVTRFRDYGIKSEATANGVELTVKWCWFEEHLEGDATTPTATGIWLAGGTDLEIHGNFSQRTGVGLHLDVLAGGQTLIANGGRNCPIGALVSVNTGSAVIDGGSWVNSPIVHERRSTWGGLALLSVIMAKEGGGSGDYFVIKLMRSTGPDLTLRDVVVRGCQFVSDQSDSTLPIRIDPNGYSWDANGLDGAAVDENSFRNVPMVTTRLVGRSSFSSGGSGSTKQLTFGNELLGNPTRFNLACDSTSSIGVTGSRSGKTITARFDASGSGSLMFEVDSGNQPGAVI